MEKPSERREKKEKVWKEFYKVLRLTYLTVCRSALKVQGCGRGGMWRTAERHRKVIVRRGRKVRFEKRGGGSKCGSPGALVHGRTGIPAQGLSRESC